VLIEFLLPLQFLTVVRLKKPCRQRDTLAGLALFSPMVGLLLAWQLES